LQVAIPELLSDSAAAVRLMASSFGIAIDSQLQGGQNRLRYRFLLLVGDIRAAVGYDCAREGAQPSSITMKLPRRNFLYSAVSAAAVSAVSRVALALDYPTRPVRLVVGFFAGGLSDILARVMAQALSKRLGQQVVVDDQPGAGSNMATDMVVRATPDGYTLLEVTSGNVWNVSLYDNLSFDFIRDIAPVACMARTPGVMAVTPSFPANTVPDFIAYGKANPGKINMASAGIGSLPHVAGELFKFMTGVDLVHVPYRGGYIPDLLSGQVQVVFSPIPTLIEQVRAGKLKALAVTGVDRSPALPDLPTIGQFVPGYEASAFNGVGAPRRTPVEIIDKLNAAISAALADHDIEERFAQLGTVPISLTPAEFGKLLNEEMQKWAKVFKSAGIKAE
jgi:tripartite-type tricarboxylate transporter receptor subunit TctC